MHGALATHLGSGQVTRVVYGAIVGLTLVVAVEDRPQRAGAAVAWLIGCGITVALAEVYCDIVGTQTRQRRRLTRQDLTLIVDNAVASAFGVAFPAVFFLLALVGLADVRTAFGIAKWGGLALIAFYGYWAARFADVPVVRALIQAIAVAAVGACVIALKAFVH